MKTEKIGVIYTCITDGYDELYNHTYMNSDWDYVCFTDNLSIKNDDNSMWEIKPLVFKKLDNVRNQRWHKLHPHVLFSEYKKSIWVDANIDILTGDVFNDVKKAEEKSSLISVSPHPNRFCIYDEALECVRIKKDDSLIIGKQINLIKKDGFPIKQGLFETAVMYREHLSEKVIKIMVEWWWWIENYSKRDQLSLTYVSWKNKFKILPLTDITYRRSDGRVTFGGHNADLRRQIDYLKNQIKYNCGSPSELTVIIQKKDHKISSLRQIIKQKENEIESIKSSKLWKIKDVYKKIKTLGLDYLRKLRKKDYKILKSRVDLKLDNYDKWINANENWNVAEIKKEIELFKNKPKISVVIPVNNENSKWLDCCIKSLKNQLYENWEVFLHDNTSTKKETADCLRRWEDADSRIKVSRGNTNQSISEASNNALKTTTGEFIALIDSNDEISPNALYEITKLINERPEVDLIYSDEDKIDDSGKRFAHFFKPGWSPELFYSLNYLEHFFVIRKSIGDEIGWFRKEYEGAENFDLILRVIGKTKNIAHISKILCHCRIPENIRDKPDTQKIEALKDFLRRNNINAMAEPQPGKVSYRLRYELPSDELVSIIIPFKDKVDLLRKCLDSIISKSTHKKYELILVSNNSSEKETFRYLDTLKKYENVRVFEKNIKFNFSELNNWAVKQASGKFVVFLNNDTEIISPQWIEEMLMHANRKEIGAVGTLLYYPDKTIQHAGVILGMNGLAGHIFRKQKDTETYHNLVNYPRNYLAVTAACMMVSKEKFIEVGGFNEAFTVCGNDVDLCLKLYEKGYLNVFTPYAKLMHHESVSREQKPPECDVEISKIRYAPYIGNDPYYNRNLSLKNGIVDVNG